MEIILLFQVTMDQEKAEKLFLVCFCRFLTSASSLRPWNAYIYVFQVVCIFYKFLTNFCDNCFVFANLQITKHVYLTFWSFVWFHQFFRKFLSTLGPRSNLIFFYAKFSVNRVRLLASTWTSLLLGSKPAERNYRHFFLNFKPKSGLWELIKVWFLLETNLMKIILG